MAVNTEHKSSDEWVCFLALVAERLHSFEVNIQCASLEPWESYRKIETVREGGMCTIRVVREFKLSRMGAKKLYVPQGEKE